MIGLQSNWLFAPPIWVATIALPPLPLVKRKKLLQSEHPLIKYYRLAIDQFNGVAFGDPQVGHINPTGVKFVETFINDRGKAIEALFDGIVVLLEWINEMVGTTGQFPPCEDREEVQRVYKGMA
jgi:hypothetical protein